MEHINNNHGLPVWNADVENNRNCGILHTEQAFNGVLRTYDIPVGQHEIDLLSFMMSKRDEIENIVQLNTQTHAQKLQFSAKIELIKPSGHESENSQRDQIKFFFPLIDFTGLN